ncbi:MAG: hypothetical protein AAF211_19605, partial [Myxococcota bacterium]
MSPGHRFAPPQSTDDRSDKGAHRGGGAIPPTVIQRLALGMLAVLLIVFGTFRISPIDVPEHLAVGRWILEHGRPMTENVLSWSYPDFPNAQQYPLYQIAIVLLKDGLGFWSLSVFCAVTWFAAVATWAHWAGGVERLAKAPILWFLAVVGVQRHLVARPEVATVLGLAVLLVLFERWRDRPAGR